MMIPAAVVIPDGSLRPLEAMQKIYAALASSAMPVPVDVPASAVLRAKRVYDFVKARIEKTE